MPPLNGGGKVGSVKLFVVPKTVEEVDDQNKSMFWQVEEHCLGRKMVVPLTSTASKIQALAKPVWWLQEQKMDLNRMTKINPEEVKNLIDALDTRIYEKTVNLSITNAKINRIKWENSKEYCEKIIYFWNKVCPG